MTRATRVALLSAIFSITYFLVLFAFIPVPFIAKQHTEQILPVVRCIALLLAVTETYITSSYHGGCLFRLDHMRSGLSGTVSTPSENARTHIRSC